MGTSYHRDMVIEDGRPPTTTFMDYLIPTAHDVLMIEEIFHIGTGSPFTALGIKGVGESGTVFSPAAIGTGVADAIGVYVDRHEVSPSRVRELVQ